MKTKNLFLTLSLAGLMAMSCSENTGMNFTYDRKMYVDLYPVQY